MIFPEARINRLAKTMAIPADEITAHIGEGESHRNSTGYYLFRESMPRL